MKLQDERWFEAVTGDKLFEVTKDRTRTPKRASNWDPAREAIRRKGQVSKGMGEMQLKVCCHPPCGVSSMQTRELFEFSHSSGRRRGDEEIGGLVD